MTSQLAVAVPTVYKVNGSRSPLVSGRAASLHRTHLLLAWIGSWIGLLVELLSLLIPVLEAFDEEAAAIGLEVNWYKTKVQALGTQQPDTKTLDVHACAPGCSC